MDSRLARMRSRGRKLICAGRYRFVTKKATERRNDGTGMTRDLWATPAWFWYTPQLRRAAFSIPANIAERSAKRGTREFRRFLDIAVGSFAEVSYALRFSRDVGLLSPKDFGDLEPLRVAVGKLTWGLYATIAKTARNAT